MSTDHGRYVPVNTTVLLQTLVEAVNDQVQERLASRALLTTPPALDADDQALVGDNERSLDLDLRLSGYLARLVEVELFEPARRPATWVRERVEQHAAQTDDVDEAMAALCAALARAEPVDKPSPDDPDAMSWQVPGPGGHVRHHLARRAIEDLLRPLEEPVKGEPADLKRAWMYGFFVRTCEEALLDDSVAEPAGA
jgi:hypothetical protein